MIDLNFILIYKNWMFKHLNIILINIKCKWISKNEH